MNRVKLSGAIALMSGTACLAIMALAGHDEPGALPAGLPFPRGKSALDGPNGLSRNAEPSVAPGSPLACDQPHITIGETSKVQQAHEFLLKNISDEVVRITRTEKACECVKREFTRYELAPAETSTMTLDFPIRTPQGVIGDFLERLEIYVNDKNDHPAVALSVAGTYIPPAYRVGEGIHIELPLAGPAEFSGSAEIRVNTARGYAIGGLRSAGPLPFDVRLGDGEDLPGAQEQRFTVHVAGTVPPEMKLPATGAVIAKINSEEVPQLRIPVVVFKPQREEVEIKPDRLAFGILQPGAAAERTIAILLPKNGDFAVDDATPSMEGLRVEIDARSGESSVALLRCKLDAASLQGKIDTEIAVTIRSAAGSRETYTVPVSGFVKPADHTTTPVETPPERDSEDRGEST